LGVVCYEVASGSHPFTQGKKDLSGLLTDILFTNPAPIRALAPDVPEWLEALLGKAMSKNPEERPKNAGEVRALLAAGASAPQAASAPTPPPVPAASKQVAPSAAPSPITRPVPAAPARPAAVPRQPGSDLDMTVVMSRPKTVAGRPDEPKSASPVILPRSAPPKQGWRSKFGVKVYCLSCTFGNPLGVIQCQRCGHPLEAETIAVAAHTAHHRAKIWWITAAAVVGVAVILGVMMVFLADKL